MQAGVQEKGCRALASCAVGRPAECLPRYVDSQPPPPPQLLPRDPEPPGRTNSSMFGRLAPHPGQLSECESVSESRRPRPRWVRLDGEKGFSQREGWEGSWGSQQRERSGKGQWGGHWSGGREPAGGDPTRLPPSVMTMGWAHSVRAPYNNPVDQRGRSSLLELPAEPRGFPVQSLYVWVGGASSDHLISTSK